MRRKIVECGYSITPMEVNNEFADDPAAWLVKKAAAHGLTTLLAHADDGVIWGRMGGEQLALSGNAFPKVSPPLRTITLQQARLFGEHDELLLWRGGDNQWYARLLDDNGTELQGWCFDEPQLQWGDHLEAEEGGFTLVAEGQEGLRYAVPVPADEIPFDRPGNWHPLRLGVRHYLDRDKDGMLIIVQSRLTGLWAEGRKEGSDE